MKTQEQTNEERIAEMAKTLEPAFHTAAEWGLTGRLLRQVALKIDAESQDQPLAALVNAFIAAANVIDEAVDREGKDKRRRDEAARVRSLTPEETVAEVLKAYTIEDWGEMSRTAQKYDHALVAFVGAVSPDDMRPGSHLYQCALNIASNPAK